MNQSHSPQASPLDEISAGWVWVSFFSACLIYLSLWVVSYPLWHALVFTSTIILLGFRAEKPGKQFLYLFALVAFLFALQLLFSPFVKALFLRSLSQGFSWQDWQYLLVALERFLLPLALVTSFQKDLARPAVMTRLTLLLTPLQWIGIKINKLQILIILALKFMPGLKKEWERFEQLQTYFVAKLPRRTLLQNLDYWQGVLKAMIAHTLHQAVITGDLLALRGLPSMNLDTGSSKLILPALFWIMAGSVAFFLHPTLAIAYASLSAWLILTLVATKKEGEESVA